MISHEYQCIFVEVPKTGTSSIRRILGEPPTPHLNICQIKSELETDWTHHRGAADKILRSFYLLLPEDRRRRIGEERFNKYFKFGFVRNPWSRVVSLYNRKEGICLRDRMSFENFVDWIEYSSATCIHPVPHRNQLDWFVDPSGNLLVDYIGKFENLHSDWGYISRKLNIDADIPHIGYNPENQVAYTEYYSASTARIIGEKFKKDIEYFGYQFGQ